MVATTNTAQFNGYYQLFGYDDPTGSWTDMTTYTANPLTAYDEVNGDPTVGDGQELYGETLVWGTGYVETYTGWTYANGLITLDAYGNAWLITDDTTLSGAGSASPGAFTYCFARGTQIATPAGERAVESLQIGDLVTTAAGQSVPVKWLGRQTRQRLFAALTGELPVLVKAGALGDGLPRRDLYLSPDHALLVDGVLVHALALVNDLSIVRMEAWPHANVEYFHIELENHELVLAEGAPAETFVDNADRQRFDNWQEYLDLYGAESPIAELDLPRVKYRRQLSAFTNKRLLALALQGLSNVA